MQSIIDKKLFASIAKLNEHQKKVVYNVAHAFAIENDTSISSLINNDAFIAEMNRRYDNFQNGNSKLSTLDQVEQRAKEMIDTMQKV